MWTSMLLQSERQDKQQQSINTVQPLIRLANALTCALEIPA